MIVKKGKLVTMTAMKILVFLTLAAAACSLISCGTKPSSTPVATSNSTPTNQQIFTVKGVIRRLAPDGKTVTIQHEEIPNYMPAMTMPFKAKETNELAGLQAGDIVSFRMTVTADEAWIDQVQKTSVEALAPPSVRPSVRLVRDVEPLEPGDLVPNYRFTNELGQAVSLDDFKGKALVLTFIFTRCPMPDFCPLMSKRFSEAYKLLTTTPNSPTNWHFLSISFDPHFDTPTVLKNYAQRYNYDARRWNFVTGAMIDIDAITEQFDLPIIKQGENWDHKLRTVVIDGEGRVKKIFVYNLWTTADLVEEIIKAAGPKENPGSAHDLTAPGRKIKP